MLTDRDKQELCEYERDLGECYGRDCHSCELYVEDTEEGSDDKRGIQGA